jgi:hypothetical protein
MLVKEPLGHSTITFTLATYSHVVPGLHAKVADETELLFSTAESTVLPLGDGHYKPSCFQHPAPGSSTCRPGDEDEAHHASRQTATWLDGGNSERVWRRATRFRPIGGLTVPLPTQPDKLN